MESEPTNFKSELWIFPTGKFGWQKCLKQRPFGLWFGWRALGVQGRFSLPLGPRSPEHGEEETGAAPGGGYAHHALPASPGGGQGGGQRGRAVAAPQNHIAPEQVSALLRRPRTSPLLIYPFNSTAPRCQRSSGPLFSFFLTVLLLFPSMFTSFTYYVHTYLFVYGII